ncbi:hypothetical protein GUJ93_ZPchr0004g38378 [Zizania palustris]|uniref:Uncharacterized protein n=1 Tax=Zizania palustris TaxID=103762 RepID=A0A8J5T0T1_ZIZPA|nr:hypothetical protein GUJ93_ZPchr0004g38378 [Zizania palustris]
MVLFQQCSSGYKSTPKPLKLVPQSPIRQNTRPFCQKHAVTFTFSSPTLQQSRAHQLNPPTSSSFVQTPANS